MDKEQLRQIFIEEAGEIIENLDIRIIDFEEDPSNKELLNDLFRGVHTLKGSANSFGFTRLGEYVHHFEDLLDYHRSSDEEMSSERIDLFLGAVDVVKAMFSFEIEGNAGLPENYEKTLRQIQSALGGETAPASQESAVSVGGISDLAAEFDNDAEVECSEADDNEEALLGALEAGEQLCRIELRLDSDIYFRGYDHTTFLILLSQTARILESYWDMEEIPMLDELDTEKSYITKVTVYVAFRCSIEEIKEIFEYIDEEEYAIEVIESVCLEEKKEKKQAEAMTQPAVNPAPAAPLVQEQEIPEVKAAGAAAYKEEKRSFVKIDTSKLDELFDSIGELVIAQNFLAENDVIKGVSDEHVSKTIETLSKITRLIQNRVMSLRMVPIRDTFDKMKRTIRDASKKVNKEVQFKTFGDDTEIDKTMVDQLSDPLIHLIRNAVDHGLEATEADRTAKGKDPVGSVVLGAYHRGGNIIIEIEDDGRGIDKAVILAKAVKNGLIEADHGELTDQQIYNFILQAGFSTAEKISDISGRGVGLDVVRNFIENMRGRIEIESELGKGSVFRIMLPLTLAIIDGMLVKSADEIYIIPTLSIIESFRPTAQIVHTAQGRGEFVNLREDILPVVRLANRLGLSDAKPPITESTLVCVENEGGKFAILVDELIGRQQVVIKSLGKSMSQISEISGGAVMGNGEVALILNVEGIAV
jgi:two-component system chemotaxis sensor kinase CheA